MRKKIKKTLKMGQKMKKTSRIIKKTCYFATDLFAEINLAAGRVSTVSSPSWREILVLVISSVTSI